MRNLTVLAAALAAVAVPLAAKPNAPAPVSSHHSDRLATVLNLRLRSIELQVDTLLDRELIGRPEALDLRREAQRLERRLEKSPEREAREIEPAVDRLQRQLRFAADQGRLGGFAEQRRDLGRFDDGDRYPAMGESDEGRDSYRRADPLGDPFAIWEERDERGPH
jgi:hypothetical protein